MSETRYADLVVRVNVSVSYEYTEGIEGDCSIPNGTRAVYSIEDIRVIDHDVIDGALLEEYVNEYENDEGERRFGYETEEG